MLIIAYFAVFCHYEDFQQMCFFSPQASVPASAAKPMPWGFLLSFPSDQHGHQRRCPFTSVGRKSPHCGDLRGLFGVPAPKFNQQALFAVGFAPVFLHFPAGKFPYWGHGKKAFEALSFKFPSNQLKFRFIPLSPSTARHAPKEPTQGRTGRHTGRLVFSAAPPFITPAPVSQNRPVSHALVLHPPYRRIVLFPDKISRSLHDTAALLSDACRIVFL